jgi:hypothetical protein
VKSFPCDLIHAADSNIKSSRVARNFYRSKMADRLGSRNTPESPLNTVTGGFGASTLATPLLRSAI